MMAYVTFFYNKHLTYITNNYLKPSYTYSKVKIGVKIREIKV